MELNKILSQEQLLTIIDKGLKSYENILGADFLQNNPNYITFVGILTDCEIDNTVNENFPQLQRLYKKFVDSL